MTTNLVFELQKQVIFLFSVCFFLTKQAHEEFPMRLQRGWITWQNNMSNLRIVFYRFRLCGQTLFMLPSFLCCLQMLHLEPYIRRRIEKKKKKKAVSNTVYFIKSMK